MCIEKLRYLQERVQTRAPLATSGSQDLTPEILTLDAVIGKARCADILMTVKQW